MRYKATTRIAVRLIGVLLLVWSLDGLPKLFHYVLLWNSSGRGRLGTLYGDILTETAISTVLRMTAGLYCLFLGTRLINLICPRTESSCIECGYHLAQLPEHGNCPECGTPYQKPASKAESRSVAGGK
ncbi:MAG: hypothetical protein AB7N71_02060 [Phycisphaerae bacterium]